MERLDDPDRERETPASGRAVAALVFGILALTGFLPCVGSVAAIVLATGERSSVGRAGFLLGCVSLVLPLFALLLLGCFGVPLVFFGFF